uniref:non-specific serine/threonine protein kinase n=1 Tax=Lactuca sativa TaxID=4236 RepID=A0A9R1V3J4_LACSA|nr:hypothetical protein LSAT_V11C600304520 [Lactuca sativa]
MTNVFSYPKSPTYKNKEDNSQEDNLPFTLTHLAIVMEYASEGELFDRICTARRVDESPSISKEVKRSIDKNVEREIINHRSLRHPNIVRFKELILTPTHVAIMMEYASEGELFDRICTAGRFNEDEVLFFLFPFFF